MREVVIADSSCLIVLANAGYLELLRTVYGMILITPSVAEEYGDPLPEWIMVRVPKDPDLVVRLGRSVDPGEASALALAADHPGCLLILDDLKARNLALAMGVAYTGTIGVIVRAKELGRIETVLPVLTALQNAGFRLSPALIAQALRLANERP